MIFCFVAGSADAAGFLGVGHVFTSNMTGNLVLLGIECGQAQWHPALKTLYVLVMFAVGVGVGSRLTRRFSDRAWDLLVRRLTMIEAGLLILFAVFWALATEERRLVHFYDLIPFLAMAMGIQSAAMKSPDHSWRDQYCDDRNADEPDGGAGGRPVQRLRTRAGRPPAGQKTDVHDCALLRGRDGKRLVDASCQLGHRFCAGNLRNLDYAVPSG